jgi:hypothetical protein
MKLTLNEKLEFIAECEEAKLHPQAIDALLEAKERPESCKRFNTVEELMADLEAEDNTENDDIECTAEGLPIIYEKKCS